MVYLISLEGLCYFMFCPECGFKNRKSAKFCANCGIALYKSSPSKGVPKASSKPKPHKIQIKHSPHIPSPISTSIHTSTPLPIGTVLDKRYKVISHIATGGMGAIYKGEDTRLKTIVAIKEMLDNFQNFEDRKYAIQRFREEALILAGLRHPNIPRVTDNFIENGRYYLIMDFVEGESTEKILKRSFLLPIDRVIWWAIQICDVLQYLHTHSPPIIYRDMKPSNIMVKKDDQIMLVDFGIARHFTPRRPGTMIGTCGYAPPEQYKGRTEPRSDIYALGATLHHLITGIDPTQKLPFKFQPITSVRKDAPKSLENILIKALKNLPEERYTTALEMKRDLEKVYKEMKSSSSSFGQVGTPQSTPKPKSIDEDAQELFKSAQRLVSSGKWNRAKRKIQKALKISPNYPEAHSLLGYILIRLGREKKALTHLNKAVSLNPASATAHLYLGKAYAKMGKIEDAHREYQLASRLDPNILQKDKMSFLEKIIWSILS